VKNACSDTKESFSLGGFSPAFAEAASRRQAAKQKTSTLRPLRLCDENSILDKNDIPNHPIILALENHRAFSFIAISFS
jgi:hypothetical protein